MSGDHGPWCVHGNEMPCRRCLDAEEYERELHVARVHARAAVAAAIISRGQVAYTTDLDFLRRCVDGLMAHVVDPPEQP